MKTGQGASQRGRQGTDDRPVRLAHRLQDLLLGAIVSGLRLVPEPLALGAGWGLGWVAGSLFRIRRGVIDENLARAFPEATPAWRRKVAARVFPHIGREGIASLRLSRAGPEELRERVEVVGLELVEAALARGRGAILVTGHLGNWEIGGGATAAWGIPLDAVVQRQRNPAFNERIQRMRETFGVRVIYRHEAARGVLRSLREGRAVALLADQHAARSDLEVPFFGEPARTARGPAVFATRTGAPMLLAEVYRIPGWRRARYRIRFEPLDVGSPTDEAGLMAAFHRALEEGIRRAPEQYFWPHRRWKGPRAGTGAANQR